MARKGLVLFDIDGTLLHTSGAGVRGMNAAFVQLHGIEGALEGVPIAGRTDRAIVADAMRKIGVPATGAAIEQLRDSYIGCLQVEMTRSLPDRPPSRVLPGVVALLDALDQDTGVIVALLTGNFHSGARVKLGHFGLWDRFAFGAFGDDDEDRRALVPIARERAVATGHRDVASVDIVIIGDTPHDVDCAKAHGARAIGVTTGPFTRDSLLDAGADLVVETLEELDEVRELIARET